MKRFFQPARAVIASALLVGAALPASAQLSDAISRGEAATRKAEQTQERINQMDDQRSDMIREFRTLLQQRNAAELYVRQQEAVVNSQTEELKSLEGQLERVDEIKAQMVPMMIDMIDALNSFRASDLPFKQMTESGIDVRGDRYEKLDAVLTRADVSPAEQYRLIIEAFQAEMEYGRTIDTYIDDIVVDGETKTVDVFRFGRVALTYMTADRGEVGHFNRETGQWEKLPNSYKADVIKGIRIAQKTAAPAVLSAPVTKFQYPQ